MTHASLFSGIGGPEVAAAMLGWHNAFHCEINPFGRHVLDFWFPYSKSYEDITKTDFTDWRGKIDVLTGGFPCQPFSYAGKRKGREDERYLWPEMLRAIDEIRPTWVVGENVAGLATMVEGGVLSDLGHEVALFDEGDGVHVYGLKQSFTIERICKDLESLGYSVQPVLIPAAAVGAPHRRDRIFILAHASNADGGDDVRVAREDALQSREERIQERDEVRFSGESGDVRSALPWFIEDAQRDGRSEREYDEQGSERDIRNAGAGNSQRIRCEERPDAAYTDSDGHPAQEPRGCAQREGRHADAEQDQWSVEAERIDGLAGLLRDASDSYGQGLQESQQSGGRTDSQEEGAGMDDRAERPRRHRDTADAFRERLEAAIQRIGYGEEERSAAERSTRKYSHDAWSEGSWWDNFPTVSPVHTRDDGLSLLMDGTSLGFTRWREESIKAYGNAIVPQVMYRIFQAIEQITQ